MLARGRLVGIRIGMVAVTDDVDDVVVVVDLVLEN